VFSLVGKAVAKIAFDLAYVFCIFVTLGHIQRAS
jgi:hypothetical protein